MPLKALFRGLGVKSPLGDLGDLGVGVEIVNYE